MKKIIEFRGPWRFLSNFWPAYVKYKDIWFNTVEHAYVAAKNPDDPEFLNKVQQTEKPGEVKRLGRGMDNPRKYEDMLDFVRQKFTQNAILKQKLLDTGDAVLEEGNTWHDNYWGICRCDKCGNKGQNNLGKIIMQVRDEIRLGE